MGVILKYSKILNVQIYDKDARDKLKQYDEENKKRALLNDVDRRIIDNSNKFDEDMYRNPITKKIEKTFSRNEGSNYQGNEQFFSKNLPGATNLNLVHRVYQDEVNQEFANQVLNTQPIKLVENMHAGTIIIDNSNQNIVVINSEGFVSEEIKNKIQLQYKGYKIIDLSYKESLKQLRTTCSFMYIIIAAAMDEYLSNGNQVPKNKNEYVKMFDKIKEKYPDNLMPEQKVLKMLISERIVDPVKLENFKKSHLNKRPKFDDIAISIFDALQRVINEEEKKKEIIDQKPNLLIKKPNYMKATLSSYMKDGKNAKDLNEIFSRKKFTEALEKARQKINENKK